MNITTEQVLTAVAIGSATSTAIFWGAYHIGQFMSRLKTVEQRVDEHEDAIRIFKGLGV